MTIQNMKVYDYKESVRSGAIAYLHRTINGNSLSIQSVEVAMIASSKCKCVKKKGGREQRY